MHVLKAENQNMRNNINNNPNNIQTQMHINELT